jgi:anti-sigma factor RsiW
MAQCDEISLMLGGFEDGELEPNEMQEVARHLAHCAACTDLLDDYANLGRELRSVMVMPALDRFADSVVQRIERLPVPLGLRVRRFFGRLGEELNAGFGIGAAAAVAAVLTVLLVTPFARHMFDHEIPMASAPPAARLANEAATTPQQLASARPADTSEAGADSHAVISRLESDVPSVAVWSEPQTGTTVIWLPDQQ